LLKLSKEASSAKALEEQVVDGIVFGMREERKWSIQVRQIPIPLVKTVRSFICA